MDNACPVYAEQRKSSDEDYAKYFVLSNSDTIEMSSYLEIEDVTYSTYKEFTRKMLGLKPGFMSCEVRSRLWEHVIFHNFLQHYVNTKEPVPYDTERTPGTLHNSKALTGKAMFDAAIPALKEVLVEYKPLYIYVWSDSVKECIIANINKVHGLKYEGIVDFDLSSVSVSLFSYNRKKESLPFPIVDDATLKETHVVRPQNLHIEETTIEKLLANFKEGRCIFDFFVKKRGAHPSVEWFNEACLIFKSLIEMNYLSYSEEEGTFFFREKTCSYYAKRMMFTLVIKRLDIEWDDLYSFVHGYKSLGTGQVDEKTNIERIAESFYGIFNEPVPEDHPLKKFIKKS